MGASRAREAQRAGVTRGGLAHLRRKLAGRLRRASGVRRGRPDHVFVGAWDEDDWADCCPRNSRATSRTFVYVGPRHTVLVRESLIVRADEEPIGAELDQRVIDLLLDPRLQEGRDP